MRSNETQVKVSPRKMIFRCFNKSKEDAGYAIYLANLLLGKAVDLCHDCGEPKPKVAANCAIKVPRFLTTCIILFIGVKLIRGWSNQTG